MKIDTTAYIEDGDLHIGIRSTMPFVNSERVKKATNSDTTYYVKYIVHGGRSNRSYVVTGLGISVYVEYDIEKEQYKVSFEPSRMGRKNTLIDFESNSVIVPHPVPTIMGQAYGDEKKMEIFWKDETGERYWVTNKFNLEEQMDGSWIIRLDFKGRDKVVLARIIATVKGKKRLKRDV